MSENHLLEIFRNIANLESQIEKQEEEINDFAVINAKIEKRFASIDESLDALRGTLAQLLKDVATFKDELLITNARVLGTGKQSRAREKE